MSEKLILYSWPESGNSYKVRLLLALIHVDYDIKNLDFLNLEQQEPAFKEINPKAEVPAIQHGDVVLTDSSSILAYLAAVFDNNGKLNGPSSYWSGAVIEQVQIIEWLAFANGWIQHGVFTARAILSYGGPYNGLGQNSDENDLIVRLKDAKVRGYKSLDILDSELEKKGGWLVGNRPTIADISTFVYVALAPMGDVFLDSHPHILAWIENIKRLPGFISIPGLDDPLIRRRGTKLETVTT